MSKTNKLFNGQIDGTKVELAASGVALGSYHLMNLTPTVNYIQFFNSPAAAVTIGTTVPYFSLPLPAEGGATCFLNGLAFNNGMTIACTTGPMNNTTSDAYVFFTLTL